ncbi:polyketide cyclase, partial [Streptomyces sp. NPDC006324]
RDEEGDRGGEVHGGGGTRVRIFDVREDHGIGQLLMGLALAAARKDADAFGARIGAAAEAAIPPR